MKRHTPKWETKPTGRFLRRYSDHHPTALTDEPRNHIREKTSEPPNRNLRDIQWFMCRVAREDPRHPDTLNANQNSEGFR